MSQLVYGLKKKIKKAGKTSFLVIPAGFEPATVRLEGECSIQLSYETFNLLHSTKK